MRNSSMLAMLLAMGCAGGAAEEPGGPDAGELPGGSFGSAPIAPSSAKDANLMFFAPALEPSGSLLLADGTYFPAPPPPPEGTEPPEEPPPTGLETCALSPKDLTASPVEGFGPILVTPNGQTLVLTMYSPLSKVCETIAEIDCGRTLTAIAPSLDGATLYLAGAVTLPEGTLPEAVVWRLDLEVTEAGGSASLASTLVELARLPCAPTVLALADMNGDGSEDFLASCQQEPPSCYKGECPDLGPSWVLVQSQIGSPKPALSPLLLSPVSEITAVIGSDIDGDGLPDLAAAGKSGVAYWLQRAARD